MDAENIIKCRKERLLPALSTSYKEHLHITRASGQYLISSSGQRYLDCVNNVCHVGHCHPKVVQAGSRQLAKLNTNTRYLHESIVKYAERLTSLFPSSLEVAVFCCSGSEANEVALRMGRNFSQSQHVIVIDHGYHGNTETLIGVSPYKYMDQGKGLVVPKPETTHVLPMPDMFRGKYNRRQGYSEWEMGDLYLEELKKIIQNIERKGGKVGCFLHETILSCGGQVPMPFGFLKRAYKLVREHGGVCIADEVQTGFGRVGSHWWAFQMQDVVPDMVVMGKPMGNGFPLSGVVTRRDIANRFKTGIEYFNTFGGSPVACEIGLAVLDVIKSEKLRKNALCVGTHFREKLLKLQRKHALIGEVRGFGLFLGVELVHEGMKPATDEASWLVNKLCKENYICLSTDGPHENVLKIKPPICFTKQNADYVVKHIDRALSILSAGTRARL